MADVLRGVVLDSSCNFDVAVDACIQSAVQSMAGFIYQVGASDHDGNEAAKKAADLKGRKAKLLLLAADSPVKAHLATKPTELLTEQSKADAAIVHRMEPPVAMQFIYSRDDTIISSTGIEDYIAGVLARPNRTGLEPPRSLVFEHSVHVFHKVKHREAYWQSVREFASSVLAA